MSKFLKYILLLILIGILAFITINLIKNYSYKKNFNPEPVNKEIKENIIASSSKDIHISTPQNLKGVYVSSWVMGTPNVREKFLKLFDGTNLNAVLIDVKDSSGVVTFDIKDENLKREAVIEKRIKDIENVIEILHEKNIYVIARIAVFQDPGAAKKYPERAIKNKTDGSLWKDAKGLAWIDAGSKEQWEYARKVAEYAYSIGFDEVNFDYIRFPSDGNMKNIFLPISEGKNKIGVVNSFFEYIGKAMREKGIPNSADIFGQTTSDNSCDGIGQTFEGAIKNFDYISPMSYPSHFTNGFNGIKNPEASPYLTIKTSYQDALEKIDNLAKSESSIKKQVGTNTIETLDENKYRSQKENYLKKLRPFLQDFSLKVDYGKNEVLDQVKALNELGIYSYLFWDPANKYTKSAFSEID